MLRQTTINLMQQALQAVVDDLQHPHACAGPVAQMFTLRFSVPARSRTESEDQHPVWTPFPRSASERHWHGAVAQAWETLEIDEDPSEVGNP